MSLDFPFLLPLRFFSGVIQLPYDRILYYQLFASNATHYDLYYIMGNLKLDYTRQNNYRENTLYQIDVDFVIEGHFIQTF